MDQYSLSDNVERVEGGKDVYLQVSPTRNIQGVNFSNGVQIYRWSVDDNTFWTPKDSYFRVRVALTKADGVTPVANANNVALNMSFVSELFQSLAFSINGVVVNRVPDFVPQIDMLDKRAHRSADWLNNFGLSTSLYNPDFAARQALTSSDSVGSASALEFDWYVPLGIFGCDALPTGEYQLAMNPQPASVIQVRAVQGESFANTANDYLFTVIDGYFMVRTSVYGAPIESKTYMLDMTQIQCQADDINPIGGIQQKQFEAAESTKALVLALQDQRAGTTPEISASFFTLPIPIAPIAGIPALLQATPYELFLNRLYIEFAGESKPSPDWVGGVGLYTAGARYNYTNQLYFETYANTGLLDGCQSISPESKADWQQRGSYYWFNWKKQQGNLSTRVYSNIQMSYPIPNNRELLFCIYSTVAQITIHGNRTVEVKVMNV